MPQAAGASVLGNIVDTFLLGLALWRSRSVARWAAAAVMIWPPMHVVGLLAGVEWFEVDGVWDCGPGGDTNCVPEWEALGPARGAAYQAMLRSHVNAALSTW
jgi:hypothetical protein